MKFVIYGIFFSFRQTLASLKFLYSRHANYLTNFFFSLVSMPFKKIQSCGSYIHNIALKNITLVSSKLHKKVFVIALLSLCMAYIKKVLKLCLRQQNISRSFKLANQKVHELIEFQAEENLHLLHYKRNALTVKKMHTFCTLQDLKEKKNSLMKWGKLTNEQTERNEINSRNIAFGLRVFKSHFHARRPNITRWILIETAPEHQKKHTNSQNEKCFLARNGVIQFIAEIVKHTRVLTIRNKRDRISWPFHDAILHVLNITLLVICLFLSLYLLDLRLISAIWSIFHLWHL